MTCLILFSSMETTPYLIFIETNYINQNLACTFFFTSLINNLLYLKRAAHNGLTLFPCLIFYGLILWCIDELVILQISSLLICFNFLRWDSSFDFTNLDHDMRKSYNIDIESQSVLQYLIKLRTCYNFFFVLTVSVSV